MAARGPKRGSSVEKSRIHVNMDNEILAWIEERSQSGGPFGSYTHAIEFALRRLMREEEALRAASKKEGVGYEPEALWTVYNAIASELGSGK